MAAGYKKLGKYDVLDVIGRGGMGVIYKAVDPGIGRVVAIKMMTGAFLENPELLQRFYREAQSAGKLQHPNIVTIYDLGVQDGNPYLVMEFLEGESLETLIRTHRSILLEEKLDVVSQVCEGVGYAHQRQIIHRDIKPGNVMLLQDRRVKIVDFGIARVGNEGMTRPGQIMGSIQYMSPEQINGGSVDARSDIFSIGVLLYQLLTAKLPFEGKDTGETLLKILHEPPPPLNQFLTAYPAELDDIIQRVLAKDREQRFQAAEDLAFELAHIQERLRRERAAEYLRAAEEAQAAGQLSRAKEQLLQVLKIDRQDARANAMLRELQQQIQKQQRSEQARDFRTEAEKAVTRGELGEALGYLDRAIDLDQSNQEIIEFRDSVRKNKARADRLRELLHGAEMAQDAGDLDAAYQAIEEALAIDGKNTEVRSLHAAISREIAERDKQLQLQKYMGEARKQISSRHFTAALQLLKQAESIGAAVPGVQELINLAVSGQQQERKRQALERLTSEIEDALNRDDYEAACSKAEEGLRSYPDDRGLKKLKAVADKQRAAREKRKYIEEKISAAQKSLEERKPQAALACLQEALEKYPNEMALQSMLQLVIDSVERERVEQKKAEIVSKARDAIRRREYKEAISLLEAAREETPSSDFDDLLQFAEEEAANYEKRQKIDFVAEQAHKLNSEEKYEEAIQLLETSLQEIPDQELEIILSDIRRHVEEFNRQVQEAIANANRLLRQDRYAEAVRFLEAQPYSKSPQLRNALAEARKKQQFWHSVSLAKEEIRDAIARSELHQAEVLWQKSREQLGDVEDIRLLEKEIQVKRREIANAKLETALHDARVLLLVRSFESAQSVLETVAELVANADQELAQQFDAFLEAARSGAAGQRQAATQQPSTEEQRLEGLEAPPKNQTVLPTFASSEVVDLDDKTQIADPGHLEAILGEVTTVADHYRDDSKVQLAINDIKNKITSRITALREAELEEKPQEVVSGPVTPELPVESISDEVTGLKEKAPEADAGIQVESEASSVPPGTAEVSESVATPALDVSESAQTITGAKEIQEIAAVEFEDLEEAAEEPEELPAEREPEVIPAILAPSDSSGLAGVVEQVPAPPPRFEDGSALEAALLQRLEEEERVGTTVPQAPQPPVAPEFSPEAVPEVPRSAPPISLARISAQLRRIRVPAQPWSNPALLAACALIAVTLVISLYLRKTHPRPAPTAPTAPPVASSQPPQIDPIQVQQQAAIDAADKLLAAGDLAGAQQKLQEVHSLRGPLSKTVEQRLSGIDAAMKDKSLLALRQKEEQLWQRAVSQVNDGKFTSAKNHFEQILGLGEGGTRKPEAHQYLEQIIPAREKEQSLFEQARQESNETSATGLQHASGLLDQVIALNGPRKADAMTLRAKISDKIGGLEKQQRDRKIAALQADAVQHIRRGDFAVARQNAEQIKALGGDADSLSADIDQAEKTQIADNAFRQMQQRAEAALNSDDKAKLEASLSELQASAQDGGPHAKEAGNLSKRINDRLAALNQPSLPPVTVSPNKTAPTPTADESAVRDALVRFNMAFRSGQPREVKAIWPRVDKKYIEGMRMGGYSFTMTLYQQGDIQINGNNAVVPCQLVSTTSKPDGQATQSKKSVKVTLNKTDDGWQILDPLTPSE